MRRLSRMSFVGLLLRTKIILHVFTLYPTVIDVTSNLSQILLVIVLAAASLWYYLSLLYGASYVRFLPLLA